MTNKPSEGTTPQAERPIVWCCKGTDGHEDHCIYHSPFQLEARAVAPVAPRGRISAPCSGAAHEECNGFTAVCDCKCHDLAVAPVETKIESMTLATEPCPDCGSGHHRSCERAVAPVETPDGTACKHCGGLIVFVDEEWQHVSTEKLHPGMPPAPVDTRLTAEQFLDEFTDDPRLLHKEYRRKIEKFAEAFRDKSEAGLREEIERLKRESKALLQTIANSTTATRKEREELNTAWRARYEELRAKLAQPERTK